MSKDFRAKQVRTNKIIGRSEGALGSEAPKVQLALMKSGSADFAGGLTTAGGHGGDDVGRLKQYAEMTADGGEHRGVGSDVWMVVDGNSSMKNQKGTGETVLFLGDVVISGTMYAERQRINVTTQAIIDANDPVTAFSGSVFIAQDSGLAVGKNPVWTNDAFTDPRTGVSLARKDSAFFNGAATPGALFVVRPDDSVGSSGDKLGRVGIGTSTPAAKLEIFGPVGGGAGDPATATHQFKITHSNDSSADDYFAILVNDSGSTTLSTNDGSGGSGADTSGHLKLDADGGIELNATTGNFEFKDDAQMVLQIQHANVGDAVFKDGGGQEIFRLDNSANSLLMSTDKKIEFHDAGIFAHANADGQFTLSSDGNSADAINIVTSNAAGGIDIDAGTGGIAIDSTGHISIDSTRDATQAINITTNGGSAETILVANTQGEGDVGGTPAIMVAAAAGGIALDAGKNITLDADGGTIAFKDGTVIIGEFDQTSLAGTNNLKLYTKGSTTQMMLICVGSNGHTTVMTDDGNGTPGQNNAHYVLDIDGNIEFNADGGDFTFKDDTQQILKIEHDTTLVDGSLQNPGDAIFKDGGGQEIFRLDNSANSLLMSTDKKIEFRDAALSIHSSADGQLDIDADTTLQITAPTVDIDASTEVNISHNLVVGGNLTVAGDTTTLNTTNLLVKDPFIILAKDQSGSPGLDAGFLVERGDSPNVAFIWDETNGAVFRAITTNSAATTSGNVVHTGHAAIAAQQFYLESSSNKIDLDTDFVITAAEDVTFSVSGGNVTPTANGGASLGSAAKSWSNIFLDDVAVINFGNNQDVTLTHVHNAGLRLNTGMQLQFGEAGENISGDNTDLTIASGGDINLTATSDVNIPASVGLTFGADANKIEVDGSNNLEIIAGNDMTFKTGGADGDQFKIQNDDAGEEPTKILIGGDGNTFIERTSGGAPASNGNLNVVSNRPMLFDSGGAFTIYASSLNIKDVSGSNPLFNIGVDGSNNTKLWAHRTNADLLLQVSPGGSETEVMRLDASETSLLIAGTNKVQFTDAKAWIQASASKTLEIQAGVGGGSPENGTINIGTGAGSTKTATITIGQTGVTTTTIHGLTLPTVTLDDGSNTASITFGGADPDPVIQRDASGVLTFTDSGGTHTLSSLASGAVAAGTVFTTQGGDPADASANHRNVTASTRRIAIIGSGSVGGVHADEVYGFNGLSAPSDIVFFVSGSIKPIGKNTPHGAGTEQERRVAAFDCNLISSGSVFLRGLYHTTNGSAPARGDITGGSGQGDDPHPIMQGASQPGYVLSIDQTNPFGSAQNALFGTAYLHGHLNFTYASPEVQLPANGLSFTAGDGTAETMLVKPSEGAVIIPASKKLGFADASTSYITSNGGSPNNVSAVAHGSLSLSGGTGVVMASGWTAAGQTCANLGTVSAATSITSTAFAGNLTGDVTGDVTGNADSATALATPRTFKVDLTSTSASSGFNGGANVTDIGVNGTLPVANGGTGLTDISTLLNSNVTKASLGLVIGTNVQAYDAELAAIAGLTSAADKGIQFTGSGTAATYDLTAAGKALLDDADAAAQRTTMGVAIGSDVQAYDADLAAIAGLTSAADKGIQFTGSGTAAVYDLTAAGKALLDDADAAAQRTTLGLVIGTDVQAFDAQLADVAGLATTDGGFIVGNGSNFVLETGTTARSSIGLGASSSPTFAGLDLSDGNITNAGDINCDSISVDAAGTGLDIQFGGNTSLNKISLTDNLADALNITEGGNSYMKFVTTNSSEKIEVSQNIIPVGTVDLGSNSNRFANIYTNDLNLCNEGRGNDVDGTSGNWTIQEGAENLYVINNLTGKKYKMALTPVGED